MPFKTAIFSQMNDEIWEQCSSNTNAVEQKNLDSKEFVPQSIQAALINMYKYDKAVRAKHIAAKDGVSISYCERFISRSTKETSQKTHNSQARRCSR